MPGGCRRDSCDQVILSTINGKEPLVAVAPALLKKWSEVSKLICVLYRTYAEALILVYKPGKVCKNLRIFRRSKGLKDSGTFAFLCLFVAL